MIQIDIYSKKQCSLCDKAIDLIRALQKEYPIELTITDIYQDDELLEKYQIMIPVVCINGEEVDYGQISEEKIMKRLHEEIGQF